MNIQCDLSSLFTAAALDTVARDAATALMSGLWEGILLAAAIGICLQFTRRAPAALRFTIWTVAFVILAGLPLVNAFLAETAAADAPLAAAPHLQLGLRWSYALAALWLAAVLIRSAHLAQQAIKLRSLWSAAVPVATKLLPELPLGRVVLCISTEIDRPSVIGFFAPRILVPAWLFSQLTPAELNQIVLHELEHLRRRDDWINLLQKVSLVLFPLNPALFWIDRRLAVERELACDDSVINRTRAPRAYAACLTNVAERRLEHRRNRLTVLALGALGSIRRSDFTRRIESILQCGSGGRSTLSPVRARALSAALIGGVLGGAAALAHAPQFVSFHAAPQTPIAAAATAAARADRTNRGLQYARFENASFHPSQPAVGNSHAFPPARKLKRRSRQMTSAMQIDAVYSETVSSEAVQRPNRRWMVLASWQQNAHQPVLVTLPGAGLFLATYAADPNRPGWLLLQL